MLLVFSKKGFLVKSFGTGDKVKLPGTAPDKPNCYEFGITYEEIYQDLLVKDKSLYPFAMFLFYLLHFTISLSAFDLILKRLAYFS